MSTNAEVLAVAGGASFRLLDQVPESTFVDIHGTAEDRIRVAVSVASEAAESDRREATSARPVGSRLGSGGATVPRRGIVAPHQGLPLPLSSLPSETEEVEETEAYRVSPGPRRWDLLHKIQKLCRPSDPLERGPAVCGCGRPAQDADSVNIHLRPGTGGKVRAGVSGVYRCGSPWLCPTCAAKKAFERAERVGRVASATYERGGQVALVVLTASHDLGTTLERGKRRMQTASGLARKGRAWVEACDRFGILGVVVGQEVTYSRENGWHYHQHLNVVCDGLTDDEAAHAGGDRDALDELVNVRAQEAGEYVADAYKRHIRAHGGKVSDKHGCHVRVAADAADAANYTSKGSMAWEVTGGHKTETRADGSMTPWDIAEAALAGDKFMYARWKEYEEAMPGTRSCVVSPRLAKVLEIEAAPDAEEGEQIIHESDEIVGQVDAPVWSRWMRHGLAGTFLGRVEEGGEVGFDDAVEETQGDADRIERAYGARDKERERQRQAGVTDRQAGQLKRLAIEAADRLQEGGGLGSRTRLRFVIDGIAAENPALPRLDEGAVIAATTSAADADRENARLMRKIADMLGGTII